MFAGHYSVGLALKNDKNRIPLWILFIAVQFVDIIWGILVLSGIEKVRIVPGITASNALDLYYMPYTHSFVGAIGWSLVAFVFYKLLSARGVSNLGTSLIVALAVFSHWILDFIVHRPDLPIYDDSFKVGLGLWNFRYPAFGLEVTMMAGGIILYFRRNSLIPKRRKYAILILSIFMMLLQAMATFVGRPLSSDRTVAMTNLTLYAVFAAVAFFIERNSRDVLHQLPSRG